jgi:hypothetical protein
MPTSSTSASRLRLTTPCETPAGAHTTISLTGARDIVADFELARAFDHEVELVLIGVHVRTAGDCPARGSSAQHQAPALERASP